jgi:hypothetical protein
MKSKVVAVLLALFAFVSLAPRANAQLFGRFRKPTPPVQDTTAGGAPPAVPGATGAAPAVPSTLPANVPGAKNPQQASKDPNVEPSTVELPDLVPESELEGPKIPLPTEPIEPSLLATRNGPFMVMARTFRGPDAVRYAQALVIELRNDFHLPAYIFYPKVQPRHSLIRGVPPTASPDTMTAQLKSPEKYRTYDEAAVLVGDAKTMKDLAKLLRHVKSLHPKSIEALPNIFGIKRNKGLKTAMGTTNPLVPAQYLYPESTDPVVARMNSGPHSIYNCQGNYTLQIGYFTGRSTIQSRTDPEDPSLFTNEKLKTSPLQSAGKDAELLAEKLAKTDDIRQAGYKVYTYHDRFASYVTIGDFKTDHDPAAEELRKKIYKLSIDLLKERKIETPFGPQPGPLMAVPHNTK